MKYLQGKVAVVTGGNSGIGYATARALLADGATVIITGRRKEAIENAAKELGAVPFTADQASLDDTIALRDQVSQRFGKIDILLINAGIVGKSDPIEEMDSDNFDNVMSINFRGAYFMLSRFIPVLNDHASVVLLSSIVATMHKPNSSVYQASKAALNSIAKTAANELSPRKIRVNIVSPGPTKTAVLTKAGYDEETLTALNESLTDIIPLKKMGSPDDVASLVTYLCGDTASFITGSEFVIDGGFVNA